MSHFVKQYSDDIQKCEDFDKLASQIDFVAHRNVFEYVSSDIRDVMNRLDLLNFHEFLMSLTEIAIITSYSETAMGLIIEFCNRICKEFDSLTQEIIDDDLLIIAVCADDKSFIDKLSTDEKEMLFLNLSKNYLVNVQDSVFNEEIVRIITSSMTKIIMGNTMDQLDTIFKPEYDEILKHNSTKTKHVVNEVIRPFQALFMNIVHNVDRRKLLSDFIITKRERQIRDKIDEMADTIIKGHKNAGVIIPYAENGTKEDVACLLRELNSSICWYDDEIVTKGVTTFKCKETGNFILHFLDWIHHVKEGLPEGVSPEEVKKTVGMLIKHTMCIIKNFYKINSVTIINLQTIFARYLDDPESEDIFLEGIFRECIRLHLDKDPAFALLKELYLDFPGDGILIFENQNTDTLNRVYHTYLDSYNNPLSSDKVTTVPATEARKLDPMDDEEEVPTTKNVRRPQIEATQSKKGYSRTSKTQAEKERKIYSAYKKYKDYEEKIDSQLSKMLVSAKDAFTQDKTEEIIEGKKFSPIGLLKKVLTSAAIFSFSKVAGFTHLVLRYTLNKKRTNKQRQNILIDIQNEITILDEKIDDAKGDGNRQAKYALMRTRSELQRTYEKIKYDLNASKTDLSSAKSYLKTMKR